MSKQISAKFAHTYHETICLALIFPDDAPDRDQDDWLPISLPTSPTLTKYLRRCNLSYGLIDLTDHQRNCNVEAIRQELHERVEKLEDIREVTIELIQKHEYDETSESIPLEDIWHPDGRPSPPARGWDYDRWGDEWDEFHDENCSKCRKGRDCGYWEDYHADWDNTDDNPLDDGVDAWKDDNPRMDTDDLERCIKDIEEDLLVMLKEKDSVR